MPLTASTDTTKRIPGAWVAAVEGAGHFPRLDEPGSVQSARGRLSEAASLG